MGLEASVRAACVQLFTDYAASTTPPLKLTVNRARPRQINAPTAFVDGINELVTYDGLRQRYADARCIVIHGLYDSGEAADQRDAFVDGFLDWLTANVHAAGTDTVAGLVNMDDMPGYVPDWLPPEKQITYYATALDVRVYGE